METIGYFEALKASLYRTCIEMSEDRYNKCITLVGNYAEGESCIFIRNKKRSFIRFSPVFSF